MCSSDLLLDSLTRKEDKPEVQPEPEKPAEVIDTKKLDGLSDDRLKTKEEEKPAEEPAEDLSEANAKLNDILSGLDRKD